MLIFSIALPSMVSAISKAFPLFDSPPSIHFFAISLSINISLSLESDSDKESDTVKMQ